METNVCRHGAKAFCKKCYAAKWQREWRAANREKACAEGREYYRKRKTEDATWLLRKYKRNAAQRKKLPTEEYKLARKREWLKKRYKLTLEEYEQLFKQQAFACAICLQSKPLCVDHDHTTSRVRGLLCAQCNFKIGWLEVCGNNSRLWRYLAGDLRYTNNEGKSL